MHSWNRKSLIITMSSGSNIVYYISNNYIYAQFFFKIVLISLHTDEISYGFFIYLWLWLNLPTFLFFTHSLISFPLSKLAKKVLRKLQCPLRKNGYISVTNKEQKGDRRDGLMVRKTGCSFIRYRFDSSTHMVLFVTPVPGDTIPFICFFDH